MRQLMRQECRLLRTLCTGVALAISMTALAYKTPVEVPAMPSKLAAYAPLIGVAKAGKRIVAVGLYGHIVYSDDEGKSWMQAQVPVSSDLVAVSFTDEKNGWATGHYGVVLHTTDGGATWSKQLDGKAAAEITLKYYAAKTGADRLVYSYFSTYDLPVAILRPFNNYGPRQHLEKAVPRFITSCLMDEPIRLHGDGSAARDYVFVSDVCEALDLVIHADLAKVKGQIFNVASGEDRSMLSIAKDVIRMMGKKKSPITFVGDRPGQVFRHTGDISKIQRTLGWRPRTDWSKGLAATIAWYEKNRECWNKQLWMRTVPIITKSGKRELH